MSLADSLEGAAGALADDADSIRPANGDPRQLLSLLDGPGAVRVMTWMLANDPDAATELATGWIDDERGAEPLLQISEQVPPDNAVRQLIVAAVMCIDLVLKE